MNKSSADPRVKKTMVRNYEQKLIKQKLSNNIVAGSSKSSVNKTLPSNTVDQENDLNQPSICSSEVLASYLSNAKKGKTFSNAKEIQLNTAQIGAKITKKLNFHYDDRIYKNLVELNADTANLKSKTDKRLSKPVTSIKKDLEPNIEDFCSQDKEDDLCLNIPVIKPKLKKDFYHESEDLHKLVETFKNL